MCAEPGVERGVDQRARRRRREAREREHDHAMQRRPERLRERRAIGRRAACRRQFGQRRGEERRAANVRDAPIGFAFDLNFRRRRHACGGRGRSASASGGRPHVVGATLVRHEDQLIRLRLIAAKRHIRMRERMKPLARVGNLRAGLKMRKQLRIAFAAERLRDLIAPFEIEVERSRRVTNRVGDLAHRERGKAIAQDNTAGGVEHAFALVVTRAGACFTFLAAFLALTGIHDVTEGSGRLNIRRRELHAMTDTTANTVRTTNGPAGNGRS
ncbi:hypothetical protein PUN4_220045 [Paraburkholderia unamae]|nr:hypothetical protein PUN4_220045 [Paraburkholderia unamae]